ncbi:MAG: stage II sporulation protein M [Acidimicrobiales bacterium]
MDVDRYVAYHRAEWQRADELTLRVGRRPPPRWQRWLRSEPPPRPTPAEIDEFVALLHRMSAQLSLVRRRYQDDDLVAELTNRVARANAVLYGRTRSPRVAFGQFFSVTFPAAVWHCRLAVLISAALLVVPWVLLAVWLGTSGGALDATISPQAQRVLVERDFEAYYSSGPATEFASSVLVNNIRVSLLAYAGGATAGIGTVMVLISNGVNLGTTNAVFAAAGEQGYFFGLIIPHGLLELTAVVISGAAGLSMGWALIRPGDRTRGAAFGEEAQRSIGIAIGLMVAFSLAALIEAWVTPGLPLVPRVAFGVVVWALIMIYLVGFGQAAAAAGYTGLPRETALRTTVQL